MSVLLSASTHAQTTPPTTAQSVRKTPLPAVPQPATRAPDPELDIPDTDTAKRVGGYGQEAVGGADCRVACDKAYYMCLSTDEGGQCGLAWSQCLTACPEHSSNF
ncbi:MAG TPA: hypothetical protein VMU59_07595 [Caulobacteraceae bacterium]|nr:hypothetical protein [Caulobacteraceae bacterium]